MPGSPRVARACEQRGAGAWTNARRKFENHATLSNAAAQPTAKLTAARSRTNDRNDHYANIGDIAIRNAHIEGPHTSANEATTTIATSQC
jgi:hypothetical protein